MSSHDFDFLRGSWRVHHWRRGDPFDPCDASWVEFDTAVGNARPVLGGLGNVDETVGVLPNGNEFVGLSLRLYDPAGDRWGIWWASTAQPGVLEEPVYGSFAGGVGEFVGSAVHEGRPYLARFHWREVDSATPIWEQDFSFDDGATWDPVNWRMEHSRLDS